MRRGLLVTALLLALGVVAFLLLDEGDGPSAPAAGAPGSRGSDAAHLVDGDVPALAGQGVRSGGHSQASLAVDAAAIETPTGALTGRVVDEAGMALAGVEITLRPSQAGSRHGSPPWPPRALHAFLTAAPPVLGVTDEDGAFAIDGAADGRVWLLARKTAYAPTLRRVHLQGGLPATGPVDLVLSRGVLRQGRLVDARGRGEAGVHVALGDLWQGGPGQTVGLAVTDSDGRWHARLREDTYALLAAKPDEPRVVTALLRPAATLPWPVPVDAPLRVLETRSKRPLGRAAYVTICSQGGALSVQEATWGRVDGEGRAAAQLAPGALRRIRIEHPRVGRCAVEYPGAGGRAAQLRATVLPRANDEREVLVGAEADGTVAGMVFDAEGQPVAGAWVLCFLPSRAPITVRSDAGGRYRLRAARQVLEGAFALGARAPGLEPYERELAAVTLGADATRREDIHLARGVALVGRVLDEAGRPVAGARVRSSAHDLRRMVPFDRGAPVPPPPFADKDGDTFFTDRIPPFVDRFPSAPMLVWEGPDAEAGVLTDAQGRYVLAGLPARTEATVFAEHSRMAGATHAEISVGRGPRQRAPDLVLRATRTLPVRVVDAGGRPRAGAQVRLLPGGQEHFLSPLDMFPPVAGQLERVSDADGRVRFAGVGPELHTLIVLAAGTAGVLQEVDPALHLLPEVVATLRTSAPIEGRVVDHEGRALAGVDLHLRGTAGGSQGPAQWIAHSFHRVDAQGRFRIHVAPSGLDLTFAFTHAFFQSVEREVRSGQRGLEIRLEPHDVAAYERLRAALQAYETFAARPVPEGTKAAEAHARRAAWLETKLEEAREACVSASGGAACGGGRGCG